MLTKKLADLGCEVVAVDSSTPQVEAARSLGLEAYVMKGEELPYRAEFDAVFSNAVLHWIKRADVMIEGVYRSLRPGGRFVAECGGHGCVDKIRTALVRALDRRGVDGESVCPGIFQLPGTTQLAWNVSGFESTALHSFHGQRYRETSSGGWKHSDTVFWWDYRVRRKMNTFRKSTPFWNPNL